MTFKTQAKTDAQNILLNTDEFGEVITYTPHGAAAQTDRVGVIDRSPIGLVVYDGEAEQETAILELCNDADNYGVASPAKGNTVAFDSNTFIVHKIENADVDGMFRLTLIRHKATEQTARDDFRVRR